MPDASPGPVAIGYAPDGFETRRANLNGRHAAGESFLAGTIRHGGAPFFGYLLDPRSGAAFARTCSALGANPPYRVIPPHRLDRLAEVGTLWLPGPPVGDHARRRSLYGAHGYSITGITHTTATRGAMAAIADIAVAPLQPWDALICTSQAVLAQVRTVLREERARLAERLGATRFPEPALPVIPLGLDTAAFAADPAARAAWRTKLGATDEDIVVLYLGRLNIAGKAHPLPMFAALGRAAARLARPPRLVLAGWFANPRDEATFREQAAALCPTVKLDLLDGRDAAVRDSIRAAADIFTLLPDNVQETFGLAPLEAMAAGLPVVVSDWDGFRDTVRHGEDGFLVPTLMVAPGGGGDIALRYATEAVGEYGAQALTGRLAAVDVAAATEAFVALAADSALRRRMGAAAQARARATFDWAVVMAQYRTLWGGLRAIRLAAAPAPQQPAAIAEPRFMDPTVAFAAWPSATLHRGVRLRAVAGPASEDLALLARFTAIGSEPGLPIPAEAIASLLARMRADGPLPAHALLDGMDLATRRRSGLRTLVWLVKVGLAAPA